MTETPTDNTGPGPGGRIEPIELQTSMQRAYIDYAMAVIVGRALPDVRDGQQAGKKLPKENPVQRYKGLGEMNAKELWETTMDPEQRLLLQVTLDDAAHADEIFSILMGEDVEQRRSFIQRNAKDVRFLDI